MDTMDDSMESSWVPVAWRRDMQHHRKAQAGDGMAVACMGFCQCAGSLPNDEYQDAPPATALAAASLPNRGAARPRYRVRQRQGDRL